MNPTITVEHVTFSVASEGDRTRISWTGGLIKWRSGIIGIVATPVCFGNADHVSDRTTYVFWRKGDTHLSSTQYAKDAFKDDNYVLAAYSDGHRLIVDVGRTVIDDSKIDSSIIDCRKPDARRAGQKPSNPKDAVGIRKWRNFVTVPLTVIAEVGTAMLEGHLKYRRHNYRVAGVRASVYVDAALGHIMQWWEGEDLDPDTKLSHITKSIASLVVLRDAMIQDMLNDDRPPKAKLDQVRDDLQNIVNEMFERYPEGNIPHTEVDEHLQRPHTKRDFGY